MYNEPCKQKVKYINDLIDNTLMHETNFKMLESQNKCGIIVVDQKNHMSRWIG